MARNTPDEDLLSTISFKTILDNLSDAVLILAPDLKVVFWNTGSEKLFGLTSEQVLGKSCSVLNILCHQDKHGKKLCSTPSCLFAKIISNGFSGRFPHVIYMYDHNNEQIPVNLTTDMIRNDDSLVTGMVAVISSMKDEYHQLTMAGQIQRRMVTTRPVTAGNFRAETLFEPMEETSGDFLEIFTLNDGRLMAAMADATGHGISASLFTMIFTSLLHANLAEGFSLEIAVKKINQEYYRIVNVDGFYLTAVFVLLDPKSGKGKFISAGHPPMMIFKKEGAGNMPCELLEPTSPMLGLDPGLEFPSEPFHLEKGQFLFAATDGVYENPTVDTSPFGMEGVALYYRDRMPAGSLTGLQEILEGISQYTEPVDDISMMVIFRPEDQ